LHPQFKESTVRILIETLRLSQNGNRVQLEEIAQRARATESFARQVLTGLVENSDDGWIFLRSGLRIQLALEIARVGQLREAARALTWQEFENFAERCLEEASFRTEKNVQVKGDGRRWQIDVIGLRGELALAIDCKHWNTPGNPSRFKTVADHQRAATSHLLSVLGEKIGRNNEFQALPMILTLSEPPSRFAEGAVLLSVEKLPSFLSEVTPYDESLPFLTSPLSVVENPMSQPN
jgi:hypothetical protein